MRIIGGTFKGRKFSPPADNWPTRPTTDFAREGLFNILNNRFDFDSLKVLDLFGGTGAHCYEFISRGCTDVTYVDQNRDCVQFVRKTATILDIADRLKIVPMDVFKFVSKNSEQYDYIFADPPFTLSKARMLPEMVFQQGMLRAGGLFVMEHGNTLNFEAEKHFVEARTYGTIVFSFFE
jgi:16S rRNA (guanine966-N2)-methyltransferase